MVELLKGAVDAGPLFSFSPPREEVLRWRVGRKSTLQQTSSSCCRSLNPLSLNGAVCLSEVFVFLVLLKVIFHVGPY